MDFYWKMHIFSCVTVHNFRNFVELVTSHHAFSSSNPDQRLAWIRATGIPNYAPSRTTKICSLHFRAEDYEDDMQGRWEASLGLDNERKRRRPRRLKAGVVPTLRPQAQATTTSSQSSGTSASAQGTQGQGGFSFRPEPEHQVIVCFNDD